VWKLEQKKPIESLDTKLEDNIKTDVKGTNCKGED
jgi:hypothetical protein